MVRGICAQLADPFAGCAQLAPDKREACREEIAGRTELFVLADGRQVNVPKGSVFRVRGLQTARPDDLTMCHAAVAFCTGAPRSFECLVGLSNWGRTANWRR